MEEKADGRKDGWKDLIVFLALQTQRQKQLRFVFLMRNNGLKFEAEFSTSMDIHAT